MNQTTKTLIPDEDIDRVHGCANFGAMPNRQVVDEGVFKYAFGYTGGSTQFAILRKHKLVRRTKNMNCDSTLTKLGFKYLRAMFDKPVISRLLELRQ